MPRHRPNETAKHLAVGAARVVKVVAHPMVQMPVAAFVSRRLRRRGVSGADAVVGATVATYVISETTKRIVGRRRPRGYHGPHPWRSFPSGHTAGTAALAFAAAAVLGGDDARRVGRVTVGALAVTAIVGGSRLVLDEHWPADVLAGAALGYAVARAAAAISDY
jgi:undecaprenyl-diphosphatase